MEITQIRVVPVDEEKLKAFVSVIFDECFVVSDIKIIEGPTGLFLSMPSKRRRDGTFRDVAHPLNHETRRRFEDQILARYREVVVQDAPVRAVAPARPLERDEGPGDIDTAALPGRM